MVVRVDTTNLTRGLSFNVAIHTQDEPTVSLYAFNTSTNDLVELDFTLSQSGVFYKALSKAPSFDGYLLAKINDKPILVKKIGYPSNHFLLAYKENYTIPYKVYSEDGTMLNSGSLVNIIDGFYYCEINTNISIVETLKKSFLVNKSIGKLNFDVSMTNTTLEDVLLPDYELTSTLGDVTLGDVTLDAITLDATLPNTTIKEY